MTTTHVIITGPQGAGKTTLADRLSAWGVGTVATTITTRPPRDDDHPYTKHVDVDTFEELVRGRQLLAVKTLRGFGWGKLPPLPNDLQRQIYVVDMPGAGQLRQHYGGEPLHVHLRCAPVSLRERLVRRRNGEKLDQVALDEVKQDAANIRAALVLATPHVVFDTDVTDVEECARLVDVALEARKYRLDVERLHEDFALTQQLILDEDEPTLPDATAAIKQ